MVLGGMGYAMVEGMKGEDEIVAALEAPSLDDVAAGAGRAYRKFAEQTGSDTLALGACMRMARQTFSPEQLATIHIPTLIAIGDSALKTLRKPASTRPKAILCPRQKRNGSISKRIL